MLNLIAWKIKIQFNSFKLSILILTLYVTKLNIYLGNKSIILKKLLTIYNYNI